MTGPSAAPGEPRAPKRPSRPRRNGTGQALGWTLAALLLAGGASLWWWKAKAAGPAAAPGASAASAPAGGGRRFGGGSGVQPVSVQAVRRQDVRVSLNAIGSIAASNTAVVHAQVSGVLQSLNFQEGQQVRAGQALAQIDPRAFQASLHQAEGALARDQAQLDNARTDIERYRGLLSRDAIPRQQFDTQEALVRQLEGTVRVDQAAVDSARLQLSYSRVTAPIGGRAGLKQADLGNVVQPADANGIVSITQTRPIAMLFSVPAAHLPLMAARLRAHEALAVEAWDRSGKQRLAVGRVATLDNAIDPATDTIRVKALFANADDALFPNQSVSVVMQLDTVADTLAVPQAAVLRGAQGFYVYVVDGDGTVATRVVKPGAVDAGWMAVEGALEAGERVVIDGVDRLRAGTRVEVIAADPGQRAGASAAPGGGRRGQRGDAASGGASGARAGAGAASRPARGQADAASGPGAGPATAAASGGPRPPWMDRLPPEVADRLMKMSPDERREWMRKRREERSGPGAGGG
jgi:multidrug efflux system membrane fusion protein